MSTSIQSSTFRLGVSTVLASALSFLVASFAVAQPALEPGYIITAGGDTTQGLIDNLKWQRAPKQIRFAENETASPRTLGIADIAGFGVGEYVFERHTLKVDQRPVDLGKPYPSGDVMKQDTLFLRRLVQGPLTLYSSDTDRPHFFIEKDGWDLEELVFFRRTIQQESGRRVQQARHFRRQLSNRRTPACADASTSGIDYQRSDFVAFVTSCNGTSVESTFSPPSSRYRFDHVLSLRASRIASRHTRVSRPGTLSGFSPGLQYQLQVESRQRYSRAAFLIGVGIQRMLGTRASDVTERPFSPRMTERKTYFGDLTATVLDVNTEVRLRMREANWRPFFSLELAALYPLSYDVRLGLETDYISTETGELTSVETRTGVEEWTSLQLGTGAGIGIEGPRLGGRLGLFYGFAYDGASAEAPGLVDAEFQIFVKL